MLSINILTNVVVKEVSNDLPPSHPKDFTLMPGRYQYTIGENPIGNFSSWAYIKKGKITVGIALGGIENWVKGGKAIKGEISTLAFFAEVFKYHLSKSQKRIMAYKQDVKLRWTKCIEKRKKKIAKKIFDWKFILRFKMRRLLRKFRPNDKSEARCKSSDPIRTE